MKVTLEFNLPMEQGEFDLMMKAGNMYAVLYNFRDYLRNWKKHGDDWSDGLEKVWEHFHELTAESDIPEL